MTFKNYVERRERCRAYHVRSKVATITDLADVLFNNYQWEVKDIGRQGDFEFTVTLGRPLGGSEPRLLVFHRGDFLVEEDFVLGTLKVVGREEFQSTFEPEPPQ